VKHLKFLLFIAVFASCTQTKESVEETSEIPLIIGTYTQKEGHVDGKGEGLYIYTFDTLSGKLTYKNKQVGITNPSFVAANSKKQVVAVSEVADGEIVSYLFDTLAYKLSETDRISSNGSYPCYVSFSNTKNEVFVANYGGSVAAYQISNQGGLNHIWHKEHEGSSKTARQTAPHPHMIINNPYEPSELYVPDLGMDAVVVYKASNGNFRNTANLGMPGGSGPRHIVFHPKTKDHIYVINELQATVSQLTYDNEFKFYKTKNSYTLLPNNNSSEDKGASAIDVTPDGKFLFAAVRGGVDEITSFEILADGSLKKVESVSSEGKTPREIKVDPSGQFLLVGNQDSGSVAVFKITKEGRLVKESVFTVPTPVSFAFIK